MDYIVILDATAGGYVELWFIATIGGRHGWR